MLVGILISGLVAGTLSVFVALAFKLGLPLAILGYVVGGMCGCLLFALVVGGCRDADNG